MRSLRGHPAVVYQVRYLAPKCDASATYLIVMGSAVVYMSSTCDLIQCSRTTEMSNASSPGVPAEDSESKLYSGRRAWRRSCGS